MSVRTTYDETRDQLKQELTNCLKLAVKLLDEDTWGYDEMQIDYGLNVYTAIKNARDMI